MTSHATARSGIVLDAAVAGEHRRRRLRAPAGQARVAVGACRRPARASRGSTPAARRTSRRRRPRRAPAGRAGRTARRARRRRTARGPCRACRSAPARRADRRRRRAAAAASASSASNSTIGQHDDAHRRQRLLERMELRQQRRVDAGAGLVAGPEVVAERLDDVVGGDADVRGAVAEQVEHRAEDAPDRGDLAAVGASSPAACA